MADPGAAPSAAEARQNAEKILRRFALVLFGVAALAASAFLYIGQGELRLALAGVDTTARIDGLRRHSYTALTSYTTPGNPTLRSERRTDFLVSYSFAVAGEAYREERAVPEPVFRSLAVGDPLALRYAAGHPALNRLADTGPGWRLIVPALLATFFAGSGWLFHAAARSLRADPAAGASA